jgi:hypothetical protein
MNGRPYSVLHAIRGPVTLITLGILFVLQNFTQYGFDQTWPVLLIVFGVLTLLGRTAAPLPPPTVPPQPMPPYSPNWGWHAQPTPGAPGQPYSQSPYAQPAPDASANYGSATPGSGQKPPESSTPGSHS